MVDKTNTLMIRDVSEEVCENFRLLSMVKDQKGGELLAELLQAAVAGRDELIFKKL